MRPISLAALCCVALVSASAGAGAAQYVAVALGRVGAYHSLAGAINNNGQVTGSVVGGTTGNRAFLWDASDGMRTLADEGCTIESANDINSGGDLAGRAYDATGCKAAIWTPGGGTMILGTMPAYTYYSEAYAMNNSRVVVGYADTPPGRYGYGYHHGFVWDSVNGMRDLGTLGGTESKAYDINSSGKIAGWAQRADGTHHACVWSSAGDMQDLGTAGGPWSEAYAINDGGQVTGYTGTGSGSPVHAFLWDSLHGMQDIGGLAGCQSTYGYGLNSIGQVVGQAWMDPSHQYAFVWDSSCGMQQLPLLPGGTRSTALQINDSGWIVGSVEMSDGYYEAVMWQPVPEPSSLLPLLCGIGGLGAIVLRMRR